ncbi:hypothetical protein GCM10007170_45730 [Arthrobacter liuii]|uniref:Uncharacterized protein n=1 Tax=Arthrobacter liuii TaxID=1476996 RepID=A0ABQ2AZ50_9MICC|nr:hypothetical protein GCM10007170_45730 [Arthrobacter liuii]
MRRDFQQPVPFDDRFADQAELAVLEVPDTAMDHVRGRTAGALAVISAFHERDINALECQITEGAHPVDATANNQHLRVRTLPQTVDGRAPGPRPGH